MLIIIILIIISWDKLFELVHMICTDIFRSIWDEEDIRKLSHIIVGVIVTAFVLCSVGYGGA